MRPFLICIHDATPAHAHETQLMIRDLAPLVGRRLSFAVVPNWHGAWPLASHLEYCRLVQENAEEILLHGYFHRRGRGTGPVTWLAERSDEMNGLDPEETRHTIERGQNDLAEVFGDASRCFLAPAWQIGHVRRIRTSSIGLDQILGFFSLESASGRKIPLATWTWDCGRWGWLGQLGDGLGQLSHCFGRRVPVLAIHPRDLARGFWPQILLLTRELIERGYAPSTVSELVAA